MTTKSIEIGFQGQRIEWEGLAGYLTRIIRTNQQIRRTPAVNAIRRVSQPEHTASGSAEHT